MAKDLLGFVSVPSNDNGTNAADPTAITPVAAMQQGDLVLLYGLARTSSLTLTMSEAGGQTWNDGTVRNTTYNSCRMFWCVFDGTWDADPSISFGATTGNTVVMLVFRPDGGTSSTWELEVEEYTLTFSGPSDPFTVLIPATGVTFSTVTNDALVVAAWTSIDNNTWGNIVGSTHTWNALSQAQFRNSSGSDTSMSFVWMVDETAGDVGSVSQDQLTLGGDGGTRRMVAFKEISGATTLTVQNASFSHQSESPTLGQAHTLALQNAALGLEVTTPTLVQAHNLTVQDAVVGLQTENITLSIVETILLEVANAVFDLTATSPTLIEYYTLAIQNASLGLEATSPTLSQEHTLALQNASLGLEASTPTLVQEHLLQLLDAILSHEATTPTLGQEHTLALQNAAVALQAGNVTLSSEIILAVANAVLSHTASSPTLTQAHTLVMQNAGIGLKSDIITLGTEVTLIVNNASISLISSSPVLRTEYWQKVNVYVRVSL